MKRVLITICILLITNGSYAASSIYTERVSVKEISVLENEYHIFTAERSPAGGTTKTLLINEGEHNGTKVLVIRACKNGCTPAVYTYQEEPSTTLGIKVYFNSAGLYVIQYDDNSFISVMPTKELGKQPFDVFVFSNFYSKDAAKVKTMTKAKVEAYAREVSQKILKSSTSASSKGGNGKYSIASPVRFAGNYYNEMDIVFEDGAIKKIKTSFCEDCNGEETYLYMEVYSKLIGVPMYTNRRNHLEEYIFVEKPGVLLWANYKGSGLGQQLFGELDYYNLFAVDKQVVRGLINSKQQQKAFDDKIASWSKTIKEVEDKKREEAAQSRINNQRLPKKGLTNKTLEDQALNAAKNWATNYGWKETITKTYFYGADWSITRHVLSGIITGREIGGVIVMKRPDGLCSFQYAVFAQQYDGTSYTKVYTLGVASGQIKLECEYTK
ncbi:hypothetical protein [Aquimarina sp. 2201CG5-10]|uniref:hypothetical protein n=1 Tax=Aquimarina callyspongiae TaxID=3098150 RepID=UPI002AB47150|nr:hypothetical protein [Aquimarina sp. 2201CG5-10]MDY8137857.1 hypothetical protein [Aquimarina sp. 2201CG5-10]